MNQKIKKVKWLWVIISGFFYLSTTDVWGISVAQKSREKVEENKQYIYAIEVAMKNFGTDDEKNDYNAIRDQYMIGLGYFMQADYVNAYKELLDAQKKLDKLYEKISMDYVERTTKILQELVKNMVEIDIKFNKTSDLIKRYEMNVEAPKLGEKTKEQFYSDKETKDFHMSYDKGMISRNLNLGFGHLGDAKRIRQEAVSMQEKKYEEGQAIDPSIYVYRLYNYAGVIDLCREAKKNAFMAYQLINRNDIYSVQSQAELQGNRFVKESNLLPVFDPRIPDQYKVDASDTLYLVHADEIMVKLKRLKKEDVKETPKETPKEANPKAVVPDQSPKK
ncbi:MAG: hypothetical protein OEV66_11000 [Spirochaetia bacterium]|nr:hypothetical protein [Spirochaetia bacterium]